jgi:hypothetical protein
MQNSRGAPVSILGHLVDQRDYRILERARPIAVLGVIIKHDSVYQMSTMAAGLH